jgi:hypothetical protein
VVGGAVSATVASTVKFCQSADTDMFAEVNVPGNRGLLTDLASPIISSKPLDLTSADIVPVGIIRS